MLAALYDIHGNVPALEAVLADASEAGADHWLLGGDYGAWSPWPQETIALLQTLPSTTWIRGNGERWVRELPWDRPDVAEMLENYDSGFGNDEGWLYSLQAQAEHDGVLYVHGSPQRDDDSFAPEPGPKDLELLAGVHNRTIVFGHSHQQFQREGPSGTYLVNPGSVGMPLDGDVSAAYALWHGGRSFELRRAEYDFEKAAAAYEALGSPFGKMASKRIRRGSD
jgi:predicted phosphodiesterase